MFKKAQQSVAHQSKLPSSFGLGNRDLKSLQEVINSEKDFIKGNSRSAQDFHKVAESIKTWGDAEGEDLQDVLGKLSLLLEHYTTAQVRFNAHLSTIRQHFKSIRTREESLADMKARKRSLGSKIEGVEKKLAKMGPENKELMKTTALLKELRAEMEDLRVEVQTEEAAIGDFKRRTAKEAMGIKCGGLLEFAEKMTIVAEIGKAMIEEIPLDYTQPGMPRADYRGASNTDHLLQQATISLGDVGFAPAAGANTGFVRPDTSGMRGSEWDDSAQDNRYVPDAPHDDPYEEYDIQDVPDVQTPLEGTESNITPIYTTHAAASRNRGDSMNTGTDVAAQDTATDEWRKSMRAEPQPIDSGIMYQSYSSSTPIADQFASRSPDEVQVGGTGLRMVGAEGNRNASHESLGGGPSYIPNSFAHTNGGAGTPPRISTPPIHNTSLQAPFDSQQQSYSSHQSSSAAAAAAAQDDATYFQSVGSTRAAQQAVRRPTSPASSINASQSMTGSLANHSNIPSSPYEPQPEGRKMTAAAFRKGFARVPSAQQMGASGSSLGAAAQGNDNGYGIDDGNSATAPLAIRKRLSAVPGQSGMGYEENPAPPYDDAERHASVYGGYEDYNQTYAEPPTRPTVPGQFYQSYNSSRPNSAAGYR